MPEPEIDEKKVARLILGLSLIVIVCVVLIAAIVSPAIGDRLRSDFYPLDRSYISPNIVAAFVQAVFVTIILSALYPPIRHRVEAWVTKHKDDIKAHISAEHLVTHDKLQAVHERVQHVIEHHPDIPDFPNK